MGVRITSQDDRVALFDSVSGWSFGPAFASEDEAEDFLGFTAHHGDLRTMDAGRLRDLHRRWLESRQRLAGLAEP